MQITVKEEDGLCSARITWKKMSHL